MKTIIFYGDSNTYGYDPRFYIPGRYPEGVRWTSIVKQKLASEARVVAAGENGRSVPEENSIEEKLLWQLLEKEVTVDLLSIMLGSNDMLLYNASAEKVANSMEKLIERLKSRELWKTTKLPILLVVPVMQGKSQIEKSKMTVCEESNPKADSLFTDDAVIRYQQEAKSLNRRYKEITDRYNCFFVDANRWGISLGHDHVHFSEEGHRTYGEKMAQTAQEILEI